MRGHVDTIYQKTKGSVPEFMEGYLAHAFELASAVDSKAVEEIIDVLQKARERGSTIYIAGNGGSAAMAAHFAADLTTNGGGTEEKPFRIHALNNIAAVTALGNDVGYENVFADQLKHIFRPDDVLIVISASGNSPNVLRAIEYICAKGGTAIGVLGFDGGKAKSLCHHKIIIETGKGAYGPVEALHAVFFHAIVDYLFFSNRDKESIPTAS